MRPPVKSSGGGDAASPTRGTVPHDPKPTTPAAGRGKFNPAGGFLTNNQKASLAVIAAQAFEEQSRLGLIDDGVTKDEWRRAEQLATTGVASLTETRNGDFLKLRAHFLLLSGRDSDAFIDHLAAEADATGTAQKIHRLKMECARHDFDFPGYPATICKRQFKCTLDAATPEQLDALRNTVSARGRSRARTSQD